MNDTFGRIFLTHDLPGTGGRIKEQPEDFVVEELSLYEPANEGNFAFLLLEKTNLSSLDLVALIRKHLDLRDEEVGLAGWKDKRAITRQWVSVPRDKVTEPRLGQLLGTGSRFYNKDIIRTNSERGISWGTAFPFSSGKQTQRPKKGPKT
jgi:TruD family tRNA pseudouridine synthase